MYIWVVLIGWVGDFKIVIGSLKGVCCMDIEIWIRVMGVNKLNVNVYVIVKSKVILK